MSADGSVPNLPQAATLPPTPTLADVIRHLEADPGLDPRQQREMCAPPFAKCTGC